MNIKNTLVVLSVTALALAALGISVSTLNLVPLGLTLYVTSKLLK